MFIVGFCPSCGTGPLGVRICGGCRRAIVMCDECDAVWLDATCQSDAVYPTQPELPCPRCETSLLGRPSHWASREEIQQAGWEADIVGEGTPLRGDAAERQVEDVQSEDENDTGKPL